MESLAEDWDVPPDAPDYDSEDELPTPGQMFVSLLLDQYLCHGMYATTCAILMWWAYLGGIKEAEPYALKPNVSSGHYQERLTNALGFKKLDAELMTILIPAMNNLDVREKVPLEVIPPHESIRRELDENPGLLETWHDCVENEEWIPAYEDHVIVQSG